MNYLIQIVDRLNTLLVHFPSWAEYNELTRSVLLQKKIKHETNKRCLNKIPKFTNLQRHIAIVSCLVDYSIWCHFKKFNPSQINLKKNIGTFSFLNDMWLYFDYTITWL